MPDLFNQSNAVLSDCGLYRYRLGRSWGDGPCVCWIMLNPSTAGADQDDPTIRRIVSFSRAWGFGALVVVNLFAYRATDPNDMRKAADPIGPKNDAHIMHAARMADRRIAAWGTGGSHLGRAGDVVRMIDAAGLSLDCLGTTLGGHPKHPLYLGKATTPIRLIRKTASTSNWRGK